MSPDDPGSVTRWINDLKGGELDAAQPLWERYFADLVRLARARLRATPRTAADEEDVALSAFDSFCAGRRAAASPGSTIATTSGGSWSPSLPARPPTKPCASGAQKRGGGRVRSEAELAGGGPEGDANLFGQVAGPEPTPEFAAMVAEECRRLLETLGDETLRQIALERMEGDTNEEIAARLGCSLRTVTNKLTLIRKRWEAAS